MATFGLCSRLISCRRLTLQVLHRTYAQQIGAAPVKRMSNTKLMVVSMSVGGLIGAGYSGYLSITGGGDPGLTIEKKPAVVDTFPDNVRITRKIYNPNDNTDLDLVLFQYQTCPFCCKVRAFLDSQGFSYSVVEVDAVLRQDIKWTKYKKVPMLLAKRRDGKYVQLTDSSMIISSLASYLLNTDQDIGQLVNYYPSISFTDDNGKQKTDVINKYFLMFQENRPPKSVTKEQMDEERKWRSWVDSHLVHMISPNVYRTTSEALETFEWFSQAGEWDVHFPRWERNLMVYVGAMAMWAIGKRLKKRHGLTDDVRMHLYDACNQWTNAIDKNKTKFLGGKEPNLADLNVFGVLNSMEGCQAFKDCLQNTKIGPWFNAMKEYVRNRRGTVLSQVDMQYLPN